VGGRRRSSQDASQAVADPDRLLLPGGKPHANTDADPNRDANDYDDAHGYSHAYCDGNSNAYCKSATSYANDHTNSNTVANRYSQSITATSPNAGASPNPALSVAFFTVLMKIVLPLSRNKPQLAPIC